MVSVTVVAPESGLDGDRVAGFEAEPEEVDVEFDVFVLSRRVLNGFLRPSDDAWSCLVGISLTGTTTSSIDRDLRFFERDRERDLLRKFTSCVIERERLCQYYRRNVLKTVNSPVHQNSSRFCSPRVASPWC